MFFAATTLESTGMSTGNEAQFISPDERRREVATILARGVLRVRHIARISGNSRASETQGLAENGLEFSSETRLSASNGTRGLRLRDDGDDL